MLAVVGVAFVAGARAAMLASVLASLAYAGLYLPIGYLDAAELSQYVVTAIITMAMSLFISKGLAGTRTEDVAQLAGVSKGTLYRYYASKEDLFKAVVRNLQALEALRGRIVAARGGQDIPSQFQTWYHVATNQPGASLGRQPQPLDIERIEAIKAVTGIPLVLHEQNSVAGLANRVLAGVADRIATGFPEALKKGIWTGNPVRPEIAKIAPPAERFAGRDGALRLVPGTTIERGATLTIRPPTRTCTRSHGSTGRPSAPTRCA